MSMACFLPCRAGSERVPRKNTIPFGPYPNGLIALKLAQLGKLPDVDAIILSTDDADILRYAEELDMGNLIVHKRQKDLCLGSTPVTDLVAHAYAVCADYDHILWTHVTTPFTSTQDYAEIIAAYYAALSDGYDSLMTTTPLQAFLWNKSGPINHMPSPAQKWPRSQDLVPVHEVNFAAQIASRAVYAACKDRVGNRPYLYDMNKLKGFDIDWPEDFQLAELMLEAGLVEP